MFKTFFFLKSLLTNISPAPGSAPRPAAAEGLGCGGVAAERGEGEEFHAPQHRGQQHLVGVRVKGRG